MRTRLFKQLFILSALICSWCAMAETSDAPVLIKNGSFYQNNKPIIFVGPFLRFSRARVDDRRGPWSRHDAYYKLPDKKLLNELGFNCVQPIHTGEYFIKKKHYPHMLRKKPKNKVTATLWASEETMRKNIHNVGNIPLLMDFSGIGLMFGFPSYVTKKMDKNLLQVNGGWTNFFPFDPSNPEAMKLYKTMFYDGTKFFIKNGGNPVVYELVNEPFYNSYSKWNLALFEKHCKEKFSNIATANKTWNTSYKSFHQAAMSIQKNQTNKMGSWVEWMMFQSKLLSGHMKEFAAEIKRADTRGVPIYFSWQPHHTVSSMVYNNCFNHCYTRWTDVMGTEYCGRTWGFGSQPVKLDKVDPMAAGFSGGSGKSEVGAAIAKGYSDGRPIVDYEYRSTRKENGCRVPSWKHDIETSLWNSIRFGYNGFIIFSWGSRSWNWRTYADAKKAVLTGKTNPGYLLNPYNYPEEALFGIKRFHNEMNRLRDIVMPRPRIKGKVAVLYLDHQSWCIKGREYHDYLTCKTALDRIQIPHDFLIAEYKSTPAKLKNYQAVFCPIAEYCPKYVRDYLKDYVKNGGILVCSPSSFTHNEYGVKTNTNDILGLQAVKLKKVRGDELAFAKPSYNKNIHLSTYLVSSTAKPSSAKVFASWKKGGSGAVYENKIGKGTVYTLMFNESKTSLSGIFDVIFDKEKIARDYTLERRGRLDITSIFSVIDRGAQKLFICINDTYLADVGNIKMKNIPSKPMNVYDAISGKRILSYSGKRTWNADDFKKGIVVSLPVQERVVILVSEKNVPWENGKITIEEITKQSEKNRISSKEYLDKLKINAEKDNNAVTKNRTFAGIDPKVSFAVNLRKYANMGFTDKIKGDNKGGWTDQGSLNDMCCLSPGKVVFYGVPYDIINPSRNNGKSAIILKGSSDRECFPQEVKGIKVGKKAAALFFLHAASCAKRAPFFYQINYTDGEKAIIEVKDRKEIGDWWHPDDKMLSGENVRVAWSGRNKQRTVGLFTLKWENPHPDKKIESIDVITKTSSMIPAVVAITGVKTLKKAIDPLKNAVPILGKKLNKSYRLLFWKTGKITLHQGKDGFPYLYGEMKKGAWGGVALDAGKGGIKLGDGDWELYFEMNYDHVDELGNATRVPNMQVRVMTDAGSPKGKQIMPKIDSDPATWEARTIPLINNNKSLNNCKVKRIQFQYKYGHPKGCMKIRKVFFRKHSSQ